MTNFVKYETSIEALELVINETSGEVFASQSATARMCDTDEANIRYICTSKKWERVSVEVLTDAGLRSSKLLNEDQIGECLAKYNPSILAQCFRAGLRVYLYGLAGYEVKPTPKTEESTKPKLKIATPRPAMRSYMADLKAVINQVPGLDKHQKGVYVLGHTKAEYPELAEEIDNAIALMPAIPIENKSFTPTEIGEMMQPIAKAKVVNEQLIAAGLQEAYYTANKKRKYRPTAKGETHCVLVPVSKGNGDPTDQLRWKASVVEMLSVRAVN